MQPIVELRISSDRDHSRSRERRPGRTDSRYPLSGTSWERQERSCSAQGYRVITYDRRGFDARASRQSLRLRHLRARPKRADRAPRSDRRRARRFSMGRRGHALPQPPTARTGAPRLCCSGRSAFVLKTRTTRRVSTVRSSRDPAAIVQDRYAFFEGLPQHLQHFDVLAVAESATAPAGSFNVAVAHPRSRATPASAPG